MRPLSTSPAVCGCRRGFENYAVLSLPAVVLTRLIDGALGRGGRGSGSSGRLTFGSALGSFKGAGRTCIWANSALWEKFLRQFAVESGLGVGVRI